MTLDTGVAVFARTPGSGGKSRLAGTWGRQRTDIFYAHCLQCAAAWLQLGRPYATPYWALTGSGSRDADIWSGIPILEQGQSGLGERMANICSQLMRQHSCWCLVGTDIPHMPPLSALKISRRLQESDFVFGPSSDGGFWLIAGRQPISCEVFTQVRYSQSSTLDQLVRSICEDMPACAIDMLLPELTDVDTEEDLVFLKQDLTTTPSALNGAQQRLLRWLLSIEAE